MFFFLFVLFFFFFSVSAAWWCISGTIVLWQMYMLPHWDRSCRSNFLSQSQYTDPMSTSPGADPIMQGAWYDSTWKEGPQRNRESNPGPYYADALPLGQRFGRKSKRRITTTKSCLRVDSKSVHQEAVRLSPFHKVVSLVVSPGRVTCQIPATCQQNRPGLLWLLQVAREDDVISNQ